MSARALGSFLVLTDAGLMVHRSATRPALASDREIGAEHFAGCEIVFSCRLKPSAAETLLTSPARDGAAREPARESAADPFSS